MTKELINVKQKNKKEKYIYISRGVGSIRVSEDYRSEEEEEEGEFEVAVVFLSLFIFILGSQNYGCEGFLYFQCGCLWQTKTHFQFAWLCNGPFNGLGEWDPHCVGCCCGAGLIQYLRVYHICLLTREGPKRSTLIMTLPSDHVMIIIVGVPTAYVASPRANHWSACVMCEDETMFLSSSPKHEKTSTVLSSTTHFHYNLGCVYFSHFHKISFYYHDFLYLYHGFLIIWYWV